MSVSPISARRMGEFARLLEERGIGNQEFQAMLNENINHVVASIQRLQSKKHKRFALPINYDEKVLNLLPRGRHDRVERFSTDKIDRFYVPTTGSWLLDTVIVHFGCEVERHDLTRRLKLLSNRGYRPANLIEYLTFFQAYPEAFVDKTICTELLNGDYHLLIRHYEPSQVANYAWNMFEIEYSEYGWGSRCWFLAVNNRNAKQIEPLPLRFATFSWKGQNYGFPIDQIGKYAKLENQGFTHLSVVWDTSSTLPVPTNIAEVEFKKSLRMPDEECTLCRQL